MKIIIEEPTDELIEVHKKYYITSKNKDTYIVLYKAKFVKDGGDLGIVASEEILDLFDEEDTCRCIVNI